MSNTSNAPEPKLSYKERRAVDALEEALDVLEKANHYTERGFVQVKNAGEAFAIVKLNLPYEVEWTTSSPKAHPHDHILWTPGWVLTIMRAGYGDELIRCMTDEAHRNMLIDAISTMHNLKNAR